MRLSVLLSKAPTQKVWQVENFLGYEPREWGENTKIIVGRVFRNYYCRPCKDYRTYRSADDLTCLVVNDNTISIDIALRCIECGGGVEVWYLIESVTDMYSASPKMRLKRFTEERELSEVIGETNINKVQTLLDQSEIAFNSNLGAGAMIYLRKIFEILTISSADNLNIETVTQKGKRKNFRALLTKVDSKAEIIPKEFSEDGYRLFSELSEVIHGESKEEEALRKYFPARRLIVGIIENIRAGKELREATKALGWTQEGTRNGE